ncbi:MAG: EAL domain-containing protein, partial [Actinomycetota bacterium]|nr:EAL domain-containing protein [Actinomycetota bacterium]
EESGRAIIGGVSDLAHTLGLSVTAEGIETAEQHEAIATIGCENAQGYLFGHPMPHDELLTHLARSAASLSWTGDASDRRVSSS